jgi:hypothetical protein
LPLPPASFNEIVTALADYNQPVKNAVRERLLGGAVGALTAGRTDAAIVRLNELDETVQYAQWVLETQISHAKLTKN